VKTDFEGDWDLDYDPLNSLKNALSELNRSQVLWWTLRSENLLDRVHYPVTLSADEWSSEILSLDQLVVEGFVETWLRQTARSVGRTLRPEFRSLRLLEECLIGFGFEEEHARQIAEPFRNLHDMRSKLKGHASGKEAIKIKEAVLNEYRSYREHFRALSKKCDNSLGILREAFGKMRSTK
jgi:hypothetical protein